MSRNKELKAMDLKEQFEVIEECLNEVVNTDTGTGEYLEGLASDALLAFNLIKEKVLKNE